MLQCKMVSVVFVGGSVCWARTLQVLHTGLFTNKSNHLYTAAHTFFASRLAKGADESTLAGGLCWNSSVLIKMIFWLLGIPMVLTKSDLQGTPNCFPSFNMQPQMKMVCPNSYVEYQQVMKCLCVRGRTGVIWMVGAGRRFSLRLQGHSDMGRFPHRCLWYANALVHYTNSSIAIKNKKKEGSNK